MAAQPPRHSVALDSHCAWVAAAAGVQLPGSSASPTASVVAISNAFLMVVTPLCSQFGRSHRFYAWEVTRVLNGFFPYRSENEERRFT